MSDRASPGTPWLARSLRVVPVVMVLLGTAMGVQVIRDRSWAVAAVPVGATSLAPTRLIRVLPSVDPVLADLAWMRALQVAGGADPSAELLFARLDLATTMDPRFEAAYRLGATLLAEPPPHGPGRADLAITLLEKGLRSAPGHWPYLMDIGFVHDWWHGDPIAAAHWFERAAAASGSPWWLTPLAAHTLAAGGDRESARELWRQIRASADDPWLQQTARRRLLQLDALDDLDRWTRRLSGRPAGWPRRWSDAGVDPPPTDPAGTAYVLDPEGRGVGLAPESPLSPLPIRWGRVGR